MGLNERFLCLSSGIPCLGLSPLINKLGTAPPEKVINLDSDSFVTSPSQRFIKLDTLNPKTQEEIQIEAKEALEKLNDYTIGLISSCSSGTGWILDYQWPKDNQKYPTTWYIATNAHVIFGYRFLDNPYEQLLPIPIEKTQKLREKHKDNYSLPNTIGPESCRVDRQQGYFDLGFIRPDNKDQLKDWRSISNGKMKAPRLFYLPSGFLSEENRQYYRDFAVLELEFLDSEYAQAVTNSFALKYPVDTKKAINIFAPPLEQRYSSWNELEKSEENYYSLGYPAVKQGDFFSYATNWDEARYRAGRLANNLRRQAENEEDRVRGFVNVEWIKERCIRKNTKNPTWCDSLDSLSWDKSIKEIGHSYLVTERNGMGTGSSGSLYIDGRGNLLGLKNLSTSHTAYIVPLISGKISYKSISSPEYDLIRGGVEGQRTSYKQQVERYVNQKGFTTWLQERNWEHKS